MSPPPTGTASLNNTHLREGHLAPRQPRDRRWNTSRAGRWQRSRSGLSAGPGTRSQGCGQRTTQKPHAKPPITKKKGARGTGENLGGKRDHGEILKKVSVKKTQKNATFQNANRAGNKTNKQTKIAGKRKRTSWESRCEKMRKKIMDSVDRNVQQTPGKDTF